MFPLVHYFVNKKIYNYVPPLMILGGLFPDIASCSGMNRDEAHIMGASFHNWCQKNAPWGIPLAKGIISHGIDPHCVDYYADEFWPGYEKGWCFLQGEKYMEEVAKATGLPPNLIWWKSHNFVEISYELITNQDHPQLKNELLAAVHDEIATKEAATILSAYTGISKIKIIDSFANVPNIFALNEITAESMAYKQNIAFMIRHQVTKADTTAMTALITQMSQDLKAGYYPYIEKIIAKTAEVLAKY